MRVEKLGNLVSITGGGTPDRSNESFWDGNVPWVTVKDFKSLEISEASEHITAAGLKGSASNLIPAGAIIVPTRMALGKAAINTKPVAINQDLKALQIQDSSVVDRDYLFRFLLSKSAFLESQGKGATVKGITLDVLRGLEIPLPPRKEQQRIAAILDKADSLRRKRQEAIRLSDEFLRSAYLDLAKKHPDRASVESVLANIPNAARTGPFGSQMLVSEFTEIGIPVLGIDNVVSNTFTWGARRFVSPEKYLELERYTVRPGDVLVTIMGTTGRVAVAPDDLPLCISTKHLCTLSLDQQKMRPFYLWAGLRWDPEVRAQTQRESKGAIMEGWNMGIVKGLMVSKPPLDAQLKFETLMARIGRFSKSAGHAADETDKFIASLSAKYLGSPVSV